MVNDGFPRRRPKRRNSSFRLLVRSVVSLLFVGLSVFAGVLAYWFVSSPPVRQAAGVAVTGGLSPARAFPGRSSINVLLLGKDEDRDNRGQVMDTRGRTDAIVLAHIDFAERKVNLLSIPRDTLARVPGYRGRHKVNAANQFGGPELAREAIADLTGVVPDAHLLIDYRMFERLIDHAGGVRLEVDKKLDYDDNWGNLHIHLEPGVQVLNGKQALGLVRYRKSNDGHGDTDQERIARQQRLLSSLRKQMTTPSNLARLPRMLAIATEESDTSLSVGQCLCLANFARAVGEGAMRMEVLPSTPTRSALRVDEPRARALIEDLFFAPAAGEPTPAG